MSVRARRLRKELRPLVWVTLEEVALDAVFENGRLFARTSARLIADRLGVDPGTGQEPCVLFVGAVWSPLKERAVPLAALDCRSMSSADISGLKVFHVRIAHIWRRHGRKNQIRSLRIGVTIDGRAMRARVPHGGGTPLGVVSLPRVASPTSSLLEVRGTGDAGLGRGDRVTAARAASPEGWQVSVRWVGGSWGERLGGGWSGVGEAGGGGAGGRGASWVDGLVVGVGW